MAADTRPFASLSSSLLARKGQARPAMRPQLYDPALAANAGALEDLGWNDMGHAEPTEGSGFTPLPEVVRQQRELAEEFGPPAAAPLPPVAAVEALPPLPVSRATGKPRTAFTLRLDPARHLKLRLACATRRLSAQKLVVEALDRLIATMPDLDALAERLAPAADTPDPTPETN